MRNLTSHEVNGCNSGLQIIVKDEPGSGGAHHDYEVVHLDEKSGTGWSQQVRFQKGPIKEAGINGTTHEALLAIVEDRLLSFQAGPYSCRENAIALTHIQEAMMWLQKRTNDRLRRGVEGTHQK